jgi:hypothetical protein
MPAFRLALNISLDNIEDLLGSASIDLGLLMSTSLYDTAIFLCVHNHQTHLPTKNAKMVNV